MIKVKKIVNTGAGETGIKCYKCQKHRASYYLMRESNGRPVDVPMCNVCLSAFLNFLDDRIIRAAYNNAHPDLDDVT